jgi:hypothetical protein
MDNLISMKKKLSASVSDSGRIKNVSDELFFELVTAWELWTVTGAEFYRGIGQSQ